MNKKRFIALFSGLVFAYCANLMASNQNNQLSSFFSEQENPKSPLTSLPNLFGTPTQGNFDSLSKSPFKSPQRPYGCRRISNQKSARKNLTNLFDKVDGATNNNSTFSNNDDLENTAPSHIFSSMSFTRSNTQPKKKRKIIFSRPWLDDSSDDDRNENHNQPNAADDSSIWENNQPNGFWIPESLRSDKREFLKNPLNVVYLDCETTGDKKHRMRQLSLVYFVEGENDQIEKKIWFSNFKNDQEFANKFAEIHKLIHGKIVVAHNIAFDWFVMTNQVYKLYESNTYPPNLSPLKATKACSLQMHRRDIKRAYDRQDITSPDKPQIKLTKNYVTMDYNRRKENRKLKKKNDEARGIVAVLYENGCTREEILKQLPSPYHRLAKNNLTRWEKKRKFNKISQIEQRASQASSPDQDHSLDEDHSSLNDFNESSSESPLKTPRKTLKEKIFTNCTDPVEANQLVLMISPYIKNKIREEKGKNRKADLDSCYARVIGSTSPKTAVKQSWGTSWEDVCKNDLHINPNTKIRHNAAGDTIMLRGLFEEMLKQCSRTPKSPRSPHSPTN